MTALVPEMSGWINSLIEEGEAAARILAARRALPIELAHVENGLVEVLGLSEPTDLLDFRLSRHEIVSILAPFDFRVYFPVLLAEIAFRKVLHRPQPLALVNNRCSDHRRAGEQATGF